MPANVSGEESRGESPGIRLERTMLISGVRDERRLSVSEARWGELKGWVRELRPIEWCSCILVLLSTVLVSVGVGLLVQACESKNFWLFAGACLTLVLGIAFLLWGLFARRASNSDNRQTKKCIENAMQCIENEIGRSEAGHRQNVATPSAPLTAVEVPSSGWIFTDFGESFDSEGRLHFNAGRHGSALRDQRTWGDCQIICLVNCEQSSNDFCVIFRRQGDNYYQLSLHYPSGNIRFQRHRAKQFELLASCLASDIARLGTYVEIQLDVREERVTAIVNGRELLNCSRIDIPCGAVGLRATRTKGVIGKYDVRTR